MTINRVRVALTGFPGGPGVSTFYTTNVATMRTALGYFYSSFEPAFPNDVTWTVETSGDIIDPISGVLTGTWTDSGAHSGTGTGTGGYAAPVGIAVNWMTGDVLDGHRLRGRTFMVPLNAPVYQADGSIVDGTLSDLRTNATALVTNGGGAFVVWHRPRVDPARAGGFSAVTSAVVNDKAAVLRSRRD